MGQVKSFEQAFKPGADFGFGQGAFFLGLFGGEAALDQGFPGFFAEGGGGGFEFLVEEFEWFAAVFLVLGKIEIPARRDAFQLFGAEGEFAEDVHTGAGVVRQLTFGLPVIMDHLAEADAFIKRGALCHPITVPHFPTPVRQRHAEVGALAPGRDLAADDFDGFIGFDEELQLHLLELAAAEGEVARVDFIAEGLADLTNSEGHFYAAGIDHIFILRENRLGRFRPQVGHIFLTLHRTGVGLEHEVEHAGFGEFGAVLGIESRGVFHLFAGLPAQWFRVLHAAGRIKSLGGFQGGFPGFSRWRQSGKSHGAGSAFRTGGSREFIDHAILRLDLVGPQAFVGHETVDHWVGEGIDMSGSLPDRRVHDDGGIEAYHILTFPGHGAPPGIAQIPLQLRAERAVIPEAVDPAVDFGGLVDEAPAFAEADDFFHYGRFGFYGGGHDRDESGRRGRVQREMKPSQCGRSRGDVRPNRAG